MGYLCHRVLLGNMGVGCLCHTYWEIWMWGAYVIDKEGNMGVGYLCHRQRGKYGCGVLMSQSYWEIWV